MGAAAAVATMLVCLHGASRLDPYWATATEHVSTALSAGLAAFAEKPGERGRVSARQRRRPARWPLPRLRQWPALALCGAAGAGGDLAYTTASQHGSLSILAAISSLYPVTTIVLKPSALRHQRATRVQVTGIILALVSCHPARRRCPLTRRPASRVHGPVLHGPVPGRVKFSWPVVDLADSRSYVK